MAARTYGGWCDKWLLGHLAADKWRLIHLAARVDPYNMGQMAVGTFGCYKYFLFFNKKRHRVADLED